MTICNEMELGLTQQKYDDKINLFGKSLLWVTKISSFLIKRYDLYLKRQAFNNLLYVDASVLNDIGVNRADIEWASNLPLKCNAALMLEKLKAENKVTLNEDEITKRQKLAMVEMVKSRHNTVGMKYL
jgi:uncharacterized protein YjiS (DUF1127 family)